jgi:hypothetical protein
MKYLLFVIGIVAVALVAGLAHLQLLAALWIPLFMLLFLLGFPVYAVVGESSLFWGLFDLDLSCRLRLPIRHYFATLSAFAVAGSAICILHIVLLCGHDRFGITPPHFWHWVARILFLEPDTGSSLRWLLGAICAFSSWFMVFALATSWNQDRSRSLFRMVAGVALALATGAAGTWLVVHDGAGIIERAARALEHSGMASRLGAGYAGHLEAHLTAVLAWLLSTLLYAGLGLYGYKVLGKAKMVAALIGPLMALLVLGWAGSALQFYLGKWNIPLLLAVAALGWISGFLPWADHTYDLLPRNTTPAPQPFEVLMAKDRNCAIVVAAAGGGIQAAAWTAKVLQELHNEFGADFDRALCLVSSISGGSTGTACYVDWLSRGAPHDAVKPFDAAAASSLDEVSWGLAWPDLLRVLIAWPFQMDRALAMERAWIYNDGSDTINQPLSNWNPATTRGDLPAVILNSTMVEMGGPLLLGTSDVDNPETGRKSSCWWDGDRLHMYRGKKLDVPIVRAARLSATFPFVTPAARPSKADHEPHMMDGGFFDNYGIATLTEWLEQALEEQAKKSTPGSERVKRVLVVQVNGFPHSDFKLPKKSSGGWVSQLIYPIKILVNVRTAGQVTHRDVELSLLKGKWRARGIEIDNVNFELDEENAPLSWHLMPKQRAAVDDAWTKNPYVVRARAKVAKFLAEHSPAGAEGLEPALAGTVTTEAGSSV